MSLARKPKKNIIFFVVAALVAGIFALGAIGLTLVMIGSANNAATTAQQEADEAKRKADEELKRLKKTLSQSPVSSKRYEVQALVEIPSGTLIKDNMVAPVELEESQIPTPGAFRSPMEAVGKVSSIPIHSGEAVTRAKVLDPSAGVPIKAGMRAVTIAVDQVGGLNGAIEPGSSVDVLTTILKDDNRKLTKTLLQNVKILNVGTSGGAPGGKGGGSIGSVTLAVSPSQAEMLVLANLEGKFHLALRNDLDDTRASVPGADVHNIITGVYASPKNMPAPPRAPKPTTDIPVSFGNDGLPYPSGPGTLSQTFTMTIMKGTSSEDKTFDVSDN